MQNNYPDIYQKALDQKVGEVTGQQKGIALFRKTFGELTSEQLGSRVEKLYAESFYFNDTFKTLHERDALVQYLQETGERLDECDVLIEQVMQDAEDVYLRWQMRMRFTAAGRTITSESIGITHLRFDAQGQIVLHQDFWDGAHGFYRHLPVVGSMLEWVRKRL